MKKILGSILLFTEVCLLAVAQQTPGQVDGHSTTGSTAAGISNVFLLNPGWNLNQMTALFSRFNGVKVNSYSITSNVVTMQGINAFNAGDILICCTSQIRRSSITTRSQFYLRV